MVKLICWFFVIVMLKGSVVLQPAQCERARRGAAREGLLGSVRAFPWLGVLRVHLNHETALKIALTGVVLVKERYAVANADDVARIPKRVFQEDSRVMFIPSENAPWFCRPVDYMTHPEYELETLNSIALIELEAPPDAKFPMKPVCWPPHSYNVSNNLYAVGYTDENLRLEKFIHKLQYVSKELCNEFYSRAGLTEGKMAPLYYECGFAANNKESCVWDNGMALVSNTSGHWVLIGLGLQGPGCSAPARFVSLAHYYSWIESATDVQEIVGQDNYRKSAFNEGFKKTHNVVEYIPAHELLRFNGTGLDARRKDEGGHEKHDFAHLYPFDVQTEELFQVQRISGAEIQVKLAKRHPYRLGSYGNCSDESARLIYKDYINVTADPSNPYSPGQWGTVQYKMSLHDSMYLNYTCVTIKLHVKKTNPAYLYYDTKMEDTNIFSETPDEIIREYPFYTQTRLLKKGEKDHLIPNPIKSAGKTFPYDNVNLYLKIQFKENCRLEIRFFGPQRTIFRGSTTTTTTPTPTTLTSTASTKDPYADLRKYNPLEFVESEGQYRDASSEKEPAYSKAYFSSSIKVLLLLVAIIDVL